MLLVPGNFWGVRDVPCVFHVYRGRISSHVSNVVSVGNDAAPVSDLNIRQEVLATVQEVVDISAGLQPDYIGADEAF